jgi:hypothetical protein
VFQVEMPRSFPVIALALAALVGCAAAPPQPPLTPAQTQNPEIADYHALRDWLDMQQSVSLMTREEVVAELAALGKPEATEEWFYFGLLNQELKTYASWVQSRDAFKQVSEAEELTGGQRQLADIFERYNQTRINWYLEFKQSDEALAATEAQLQAAREQNAQLEQKIQAITDLETTISTRKEQ